MLIAELGVLDPDAVISGIAWKPVPDYDGLYTVSDYGAIYSIKTQRVLTMSLCQGCYTVSLCKNGKAKTTRIHRIGALAFIPNPDNKKYIDHINTIRIDNRVENLRWCTMQENNTNPITIEKKSRSLKETCSSPVWRTKMEQARVKGAKTRARKIQCVETGVIYNSLKEASAETGLTPVAIQLSCRYHDQVAYTLSNYKGKPVYHFRYYV